MKTTMMMLALALAMAGCAGPFSGGPGEDCDTCAVAETNAGVPTAAGNAATAAASGGQGAENAPYSKDTARIEPRTQITRGAGNIDSVSADSEDRDVASGGAQTQALYVPTAAEATATGEGGGTALAIRAEFSKDMQAMRDDMASVRRDPELTPEQRSIEAAAIRESMATARTGLALALSHVGQRTTTINQGGDNTLVAYSKAGTGVGADDPKALEVLDGGVKALSAKREAAAAKAELERLRGPSVDGDGKPVVK